MIVEKAEPLHAQTIISLQPYGDFTQKEAEMIKSDFDEHIGKILKGSFIVEILPNKQLPKDFLGEKKTKYRADKIIHSLKTKANRDHIIIALTHKDICVANKNGVVDWGVLGFSISKDHACVASDHRLKNKKRDLWRVATHEFIHTYYRYGHCPKDSSYCIMKDAKGKADFSNKNNLCGYCKSKIG